MEKTLDAPGTKVLPGMDLCLLPAEIDNILILSRQWQWFILQCRIPTQGGRGMRILFQGDSITDAGRGAYDDPYATGRGYPRLLEAQLAYENEDCEVLNCGISGSRVVDLLARWKKDCLNLKPDVLTILVGINDVWHELGNGNGVGRELFEEIYRILLRETRAALPKTRIILMGAYVTHGTATDGEWEYFREEVKVRRETARRLAREYEAGFVDLQEEFDQAQEKKPAACWTADGIHPTAAGHQLIARAWKKCFETV